MLLDELAQQQIDKTVMSISAHSIQGKRTHMEDYFDISYQMRPVDERKPGEWPYEYFYFGIFDGHGGNEAAMFTKQNLIRYITEEKDFWSDDDEDVKRAIHSGFAKTHSAMKLSMPYWSRRTKFLPSTAGTTASVLFIKNGKFYTGHVGDSRIVISKRHPETDQWISHQVTNDHKPESASEMTRIKRAGGQVGDKLGVHRVIWTRPILDAAYPRDVKSLSRKEIEETYSTYPLDEKLVSRYDAIPFLAIARSLGDFWSLNPYSGQYIVSPEPDITCRSIEEDDNCILLATDGLWNVMSSAQSIRFLQELDILKNDRRQYHENEYFYTDNYYDVAGNSKNYAESLVYYAYQMWERRSLRSDNITVVVATLHDIMAHLKPANNSQKIHVTRASTMLERSISKKRSDKSNKSMIQVNLTRTFFEDVTLNVGPRLYQPEPSNYLSTWTGLVDMLVMPPTVFENDTEFPNLTFPKNYMRLSEADSEILMHEETQSDCSSDFGTPETDAYLYIKRVSDDPADGIPLPSRKNKHNKDVRDASAQATQSLHDFGQPWDQLLFKPRTEDPMTKLSDVLKKLHQSDFFTSIGSYNVADYILDDLDPEDSLVSIRGPLKEEDEESVKSKQEPPRPKRRDSPSIPQLRCLLNYTPTKNNNDRSSRTRPQSLGDLIEKRKGQLSNISYLTRSKRRKS